MLILSVISLFAFGTYAWAFWFLQFNISSAMIGAVFHIAAGSLFITAVSQTRRQRLSLAYDTDKPKFIVTSGPYRFVRHPFYLSYIIFWIGCTISTQSIIMLSVTTAISILYIIAARKEEAKFAASAMSSAYQLYRESAGLLWPKIGKQ
ncbi:methyltransferase family protein [Methylobacterium trifolii]|uniref:methyltransferase family protein n=1 Tax=Methylobacterium trifolii TaxID=1003092 RepID=UPI0035A23728